MTEDMSPEEIKRIRGKYGLSQKAFARLLGIGEASIVRYENGQTPTKANTNLIRAADNPAFLLDCLHRDGDVLTEEQRDKTERIVYAMVTLDEEGEIMNINQIYEITLQQEVLNEQAAQYLGELSRKILAAEDSGDAALVAIYEDAMSEIARAKSRITDSEHSSKVKVAELRGLIQGSYNLAKLLSEKAA